MDIRKINNSDLPALFTLWKESHLVFADKNREMHECMLMIKLNPTSCFVAIEHEHIAGSIFGAFNGRRAWINHLAIHPNFQKRGVGSMLLKKTIRALKERGATKVILGVSTSNLKAIEFYQKNGFKVMDDAIMLSQDLYEQ